MTYPPGPPPDRSARLWVIVGGITAILGLVVAAGAWWYPISPADRPAWLPDRDQGGVTTSPPAPLPPSPSEESTSGLPPKGWRLDFSDSLSSPSVWWVAGEDKEWGGSCWFEDETYWVRQILPNRSFRCFGQALAYGDFAVEFEASISGRGCVNLTFRDGDQQTIYVYVVCASGHAWARRVHTPKMETVVSFFEASDLVVPEETPMKIGVIAIGTRMHFFPNGEKMADAVDSGTLAGRFYLQATTYSEPVTVGFRDFKVWVS